LVDEVTGQAKFRDFIRDDRVMPYVFEKFVRNFYRHEQNVFRVGRERIKWQRTTGSEWGIQLLPTMLTDISLKSLNRKIIIDTKFYPEVLKKHYGKYSLNSQHLYQLFTYIINLSAMSDVNEKVEGILMYPAVSIKLDISYKMHGYDLRVCTVDLNAPWKQIHENLISLLINPARSTN
jgi:5-methylcytosine-specific restriction enzyme subunit McrC